MQSRAPLFLILRHLELSSVCLGCLLSAMNTLTDSDGSLSRWLEHSTHLTHPEPAHLQLVPPKLALFILSLPMIDHPICDFLELALFILSLPILDLLAFSLLVFAPLKVERALPEQRMSFAYYSAIY